ncbi:Fe-S protein assembly co-chaperone HscB [Flavihumibacter rivuli]|uniref:Fe-S protein assembly co-chaperone HscB n=1 Tax=Flavihumibacter rivuli TaxID=2838156 RepID=UPI001BDEFCB1|nr:Fe-S protein assembly co-chaperone HscB [Flavihumibacter rivuli]ULQ57681.1 Fe-S protein assembly co-chaperone HscB [Flavihumibacter rivuli]
MMNYFELYSIPVSFQPDQNLVKQQFYRLSRQYHPDFYTQASAEEQAEVLDKSAAVNKAYRTFMDADATIQYVLEWKGLVEPEEKYQLDPMFLAEVMDINEALMELEMDPDPAGLEKAGIMTQNLLNEVYEHVEPILADYQEGVTTEKELLQVKDYYYKKKYLQRILDKIDSTRNIASPN